MKARPAGECYGSRSCRTAPVCPGVRLCARAALRVLPHRARLPGGAPVRPRRASSRATPTPPRAAAPAQSYWQNATSFFVWYTVSTNCRSSGESV